MDWIKMFEVLITSITSIIVALVGAGFFRRMNEQKMKVKSKEDLMQQIQRDEIVHLAIREIRRRYNSDRVYIWQFHNGGTFYTTSPMQKISITYERCSDGLERKAEKNQNHLINNFSFYIKDVMDKKMFFSDVNDIEDIALRSLTLSQGTRSHCAVPIYDKERHLVAILALDWVFSEVPLNYLDEKGQFSEEFKEEFSTDADTLDPYL